MDFKVELAKIMVTAIDMTQEEIVDSLEVPKDSSMGDFAFPCFRLAKTLKKAPPVLAEEFSNALNGKIDFVTKIETKGAYLNFYVNPAIFAKSVMTEALEKGEDFARQTIGEGKNVVVDFSSPNIAKNFHVGHLRSTVIGNALCNINKFLGFNSIGINHLGDWGTQFGKLIVAYKLWSDKETVERDKIEELNRIYVKFHDEAEKDESLVEQGRAWMLKMQEGDEEALTIWRFFYDISMIEFEKIYTRLGITFDYNTGESFYEDKMDAAVEEIKQKGLLIESKGAMVVDLEDVDLDVCMILRSDGGTLYHTRDIAAALYRNKTFNFAKALYVTAFDQGRHFAQLFAVLKKMGHDWSDTMAHVPFGLVSLESGKLSTRRGNVVLMQDLLTEAVAEAKNIIEEKNPGLENKEQVAEDVGIGALVFNDLYNSRIKDVVFSWDKMLNFDGETGPYVQYTHARACSLLEKGGVTDFSNADFSILTDEASINVIKILYFYKDKLIDAMNKNEPYIVSRHLMDLAQGFNRFYHDNPVIVDDITVKTARLALAMVVKTVLARGLKLIGVNAPERM